MLDIKKNYLYFLVGCIPLRILLTIITKNINTEYLPYLGFVLLLPAIGFLTLYFANLRLNAPEANGPTWWSKFRLIHGLLYLTASIYAFQSKSIAWIPLSIDVILGLILFINKHFI